MGSGQPSVQGVIHKMRISSKNLFKIIQEELLFYQSPFLFRKQVTEGGEVDQIQRVLLKSLRNM